MSNPLFQLLGGGQNNQMSQMMKAFSDFRSMFTGDPRAKVQELLRTGQMSQEQFNQLQNAANQFMNFLPKK